MAFNAGEQVRIQTVNLTTDGYAEDNSSLSVSTRDQVWLLSSDEAERYFASDDKRKCFPSEKALSYDTWFWNEVYGDGLECPWWLRSSGDSPDTAAVVTDEGIVMPEGWRVATKDAAVRPVIVLRLPGQSE